jgi:hypothetical protein
MAVLKLRAVDLDDCSRIHQQGLGRGFHDAGFSGARRPQEEEISDRPAYRGQSRYVSLVSPDDLVNSFVLSNYEVAEFVLQVLRLSSRSAGI